LQEREQLLERAAVAELVVALARASVAEQLEQVRLLVQARLRVLLRVLLQVQRQRNRRLQ
jgi:hypothetical protein